MKTLVVYDSNFGNTQKIAEKIAGVLGAKAIAIKSLRKTELENLELLVVGSPIIGWKPTVATQEFLNGLEAAAFQGIKATAFDTRVKLFIHGDAKEKLISELKRLGAEITVPAEAFYVGGQEGPLLDGEVEKAEIWAEIIKTTF